MKLSLLPPLLRPTLAVVTLLALGNVSVFAQLVADPLKPATTGTPGATPAAGQAKPVSAADKKFIKDVAKSFYYELQLADLAKSQATSDATKKYGELINTELTKAWAALTELAQSKGEMVPAELTGGDKSGVERMKKMKGDAFDKTFFREILKEVKGVERDFESALKMAADPAVKTFATNYLPMVKGQASEGEKAEKASTKKP